MLKASSSRVMNSYDGGFEANTLAMLDSIGDKDVHDASEDRLMFLGAVRSALLVPENGIPPSKFNQGFNSKNFLGFIQLLVRNINWKSLKRSDYKETSVTSSSLQQLIHNMNKGVNESEESDLKILRNMFVFKYLVHFLKLDFTP